MTMVASVANRGRSILRVVKPPTPAPGTQNGSCLPFQLPGNEDLAKLSNKELIQVINEEHGLYGSTMRKAIVQHACRAGAALVVMKGRVGHGSWTDWLQEHFQGSPESARRYMRIAKHWPEIEEHGLDQRLTDRTLEDLRYFLSEPASAAPPVPLPPLAVVGDEDEPAVPALAAMPAAASATGRDIPVPSGTVPPTGPVTVQLMVTLSSTDKERLLRMAKDLQPVLGTDNPSDTVYQAVLCCWKEKCRGH